jgi:DNA-binding transcriptional LysR family regulator
MPALPLCSRSVTARRPRTISGGGNCRFNATYALSNANRTLTLTVGPLMEIPADIEFHPIVSYEPVVITCLGHPLVYREKLSLEQISRYPLILPPRNLSTWPMVDSTFKKHGLSYEVAMEVGGWEPIKKYVELGLGISIIISIGITGQERLEVIPEGEFFPKRTYGVVLRKGRILTPQAKRFINLLLNAREPNVNSHGKSAAPKGHHAEPGTVA